MNGPAIFVCYLAWSACTWERPGTDAPGRTIDVVRTQQGAPDGKEDPPKGATLRFDGEAKRFILRNEGKGPVWVRVYGPECPLVTVQRLTRDGWVETNTDWCGTGAILHRLDPGKSLDFARSLETSRLHFRPMGDYDVKYPGLESLPARVGLDVYADEHGHASEQVWSEKVDGTKVRAPKK